MPSHRACPPVATTLSPSRPPSPAISSASCHPPSRAPSSPGRSPSSVGFAPPAPVHANGVAGRSASVGCAGPASIGARARNSDKSDHTAKFFKSNTSSVRHFFNTQGDRKEEAQHDYTLGLVVNAAIDSVGPRAGCTDLDRLGLALGQHEIALGEMSSTIPTSVDPPDCSCHSNCLHPSLAARNPSPDSPNPAHCSPHPRCPSPSCSFPSSHPATPPHPSATARKPSPLPDNLLDSSDLGPM